MQAKAQGIRRFEKRGNQFRHSRIFAADTRRFYRELGNRPPTAGQFWS